MGLRMGAYLLPRSQPLPDLAGIHQQLGNVPGALLPFIGLAQQRGNKELYACEAQLLQDGQRVLKHVFETVIERKPNPPLGFGSGISDWRIWRFRKTCSSQLRHLARKKAGADVKTLKPGSSCAWPDVVIGKNGPARKEDVAKGPEARVIMWEGGHTLGLETGRRKSI